MIDWLRDSKPGRALRWRALPDWPWLSLQLFALWLAIKVGHLVAALSWAERIAVLLPVVLVLLGIADVVADTVDERITARAVPPS